MLKNLTKNIVTGFKEYFDKYDGLMFERKELTSHNSDMVKDFVKTHFGMKSNEEKGSIKKQITKLFQTMDQCLDGKEPIPEIRTIRKEHLNFPDDLYSRLIQIKNQIDENKDAIKVIDERVKNEIVAPLSLVIEENMKTTEGILKEFLIVENGKDSNLLMVCDGFRSLRDFLTKESV